MTGCSADAYKVAADSAGVRDFEGPEAERRWGISRRRWRKTTVPADPPRKAFNKIPMTPIPPPTRFLHRWKPFLGWLLPLEG